MITNSELSFEEAYCAMLKFLEMYYEVTNSDEIAGMLGSMSLNADGKPMDPAFWDDWLNATRFVIESNAS